MPLIPQYAAGPRIEPPVSVPRPPRMSPAATAAPVPVLEPPGVRAMSHGFLGMRKPAAGSGPPLASLGDVRREVFGHSVGRYTIDTARAPLQSVLAYLCRNYGALLRSCRSCRRAFPHH